MSLNGMFNARKEGKCPFCKRVVDVSEFEGDPVGLKEFKISGLCKKCQEEFFG